MAGRWQGSDRRSTLPPNWPTEIRPAILRRDHHRCTWIGDLHHDGEPDRYFARNYQPAERCSAHATDVDHIGDPRDHRPHNLRSLCTRHHSHRSSRQGNQAQASRRAQRLRPPSPHPGVRRHRCS